MGRVILRVMAMLLIFYPTFGGTGWNIVKIGTCPNARLETSVEVANGRNDGINRVYVASSNGGIYEWTYSGGNWNYGTVHYYNAAWYTISIGNGRNDGVNRLYAHNGLQSNIMEATFSGSGWTKNDINLNAGGVAGLIVGNGRSDGVIRVYGGGPGKFYEHSWTGSNWSKLLLSSSIAGGMHAIGDGRNDGKNRIYSPDRFGPLYEFTWTGSSFSSSVINLPDSWLCATDVGLGRNDGKNRIYVGAQQGHLYEVTYTGTTWQSLDMTPSGPNGGRFGIRVDRTRSDSKERVYTTTQGAPITEFSWTGSAWEDSVVDAVSGATACLDIGVGRNDDTVRIYATNTYTGGVWEITNTSPYHGILENEGMFDSYRLEQNTPNPFTQKTVIRFQVSDFRFRIKDLRLTIYDLAGKLIKVWDLGYGDCSFREVVWDGRNTARNKVPSGIYFYRLEGKGFNVSKKLILL